MRLLLVLLIAVLAGCGGGGGAEPAAAPFPVGDMLALTASGRIVTFNRAAPAVQVSTFAPTGLAAGDPLAAVATRSGDGRVYGLTRGGRLYALDLAQGSATLVSTLNAAPEGAHIALSFNPVSDRARIVTDAGQNLTADVATGSVIADGPLLPQPEETSARVSGYTPADVLISALAYHESYAGVTRAAPLLLDARAGRLFFFIESEPDGRISPVFTTLGVRADPRAGVAIHPRDGALFFALHASGRTVLYAMPEYQQPAGITYNLANLGSIAGDEPVLALAFAPLPPTTVFALTDDNTLLQFRPRAANTLLARVPISGLAPGERVLGMDFHPCDGRLYALGSGGRLRVIDPETGAAALLATLFADPQDASEPFNGLRGVVTAVDFDPVSRQLRVLTSDNQSLQVDVTARPGATVTNPDIHRVPFTSARDTPPPPITRGLSVASGAHTRSYCGSIAAGLFVFDSVVQDVEFVFDMPSGNVLGNGGSAIGLVPPVAMDMAGVDDRLPLMAARTTASGPFTLYSTSGPNAQWAQPVPYYQFFGADPATSVIGGPDGPANIVDIAIRL